MTDLMSAAPLMMFPVLFLFVAFGVPVAFAMITVSLGFLALQFNFSEAVVNIAVQKLSETASNYTLAAVPLFIFMGTVLEKSGLAERLFSALRIWTSRVPGGLAVATVLLCVIFAASSGIIGATESVVGLLAIPVMMRFKYRNDLIAGTICAGGSLGTIIPPSVVVVILGPVAGVDVGSLFMAVLLPGLGLALLYIIYIMLRCMIFPDHGPPVEVIERVPVWELVQQTFVALVPPMIVIFSVLGTLMLGWATPTEAAAMGAVSSLVLAVWLGKTGPAVLWQAVRSTLLVTTMILTILMAGSIFAAVFSVAGGLRMIQEILDAAQLGPYGTLFLILGIAFIAGFVLDLISIILIVVPVGVPLLLTMDVSGMPSEDLRLWFCVLMMIVIQTSYITPPFAPAIFYLRAVAPPEMKLTEMYMGVIPFIVIQLMLALLIVLIPDIALWLPGKVAAMRSW